MNARGRSDRKPESVARPRRAGCGRIRTAGTALGLFAALVASAGAAPQEGLMACAFPEPPHIPDGCAASGRTFDRGHRAVRRFMTGIEQSLACIEAHEAGLGRPDEETRARITALYNNGVDQMQLIAGAFNEQLRRREQGCNDPLPSEPGAEAMTPDQVRGLEPGRHH